MFCLQCGKEVADDQKFCHHCGARLRKEAMSSAESAPLSQSVSHPGVREKTPWEDRETLGFFRGLFKTLNEVLFRPGEFYKKMQLTGGLTDPLLFALIVGMTGLIIMYLWQILLKGTMQGMMPGMQAAAGQNMFQDLGVVVLAFLSPFLIIIGLFISSGVLHVCLMMVKGARFGFETTFRVVAYGYSANIFLIIPVCGNFIAVLWALVLYIIGLKEAHETTGGKAVFAVFLPAVVCCGLILFAVALFLGAAAGSLGLMMPR